MQILKTFYNVKMRFVVSVLVNAGNFSSVELLRLTLFEASDGKRTTANIFPNRKLGSSKKLHKM